jgi:hypothetical protein
MDNHNELVLRIDPDKGRITVEDHSDGTISRKNISADALLECIRNSLRRTMVSSGLLPDNCIAVNVGEHDERAVCILHPERYADITYHQTRYERFPLPRLVFKFSLHQKLRVNSVSVCVIEEGRLKPDSKLFHWPFSNVSGFHMCIGNNVMPKCESLHTLSSLPYHILEIPNNNDHYQTQNNKPQMEYRDLLEHLKDKDSAYYYGQILIPNGRTLKDFINVN